MSARCEPPEELRGVDGWHWLHDDCPVFWIADQGEWDWGNDEFRPPDDMPAGYRYLAPVTPHHEVDALRAEASEWCQKVQLCEDRIHKLRAELAAARNEIARLATQAAAMRDALLATGRTYSGVIPPLLPMPTGDAP